MFKVNNRSTRHHSGVIIVNFEYTGHISSIYLLRLNMQIQDEILYCFNLNLSVCFRVGSRGLVTFKMKLSVTMNSSFQLSPIFCHKDPP